MYDNTEALHHAIRMAHLEEKLSELALKDKFGVSQHQVKVALGRPTQRIAARPKTWDEAVAAVNGETPQATEPAYTPRTVQPMSRTIRFGAIGDSHLCSKYERNDILNAIYDVYASEGIRDVYHTGNYIDGEARFNFTDIHTHGIDNQVQYFIDKYPRRAGVTTHFIAGDDHEGWYSQKTGIDIGKHTEDMARRSGREDLRYLGYMESDVLAGGSVPVRVLHAGGGSAISISYTSQKIVDSYRDADRPLILLVGHYHKSEFLPNYRGVYIFQTGTTQMQTPFMRKKRLHADLGAWIVSVNEFDDGSISIGGQWLSYASGKWAYR